MESSSGSDQDTGNADIPLHDQSVDSGVFQIAATIRPCGRLGRGELTTVEGPRLPVAQCLPGGLILLPPELQIILLTEMSWKSTPQGTEKKCA